MLTSKTLGCQLINCQILLSCYSAYAIRHNIYILPIQTCSDFFLRRLCINTSMSISTRCIVPWIFRHLILSTIDNSTMVNHCDSWLVFFSVFWADQWIWPPNYSICYIVINCNSFIRFVCWISCKPRSSHHQFHRENLNRFCENILKHVQSAKPIWSQK